jgi:hypothetical protein
MSFCSSYEPMLTESAPSEQSTFVGAYEGFWDARDKEKACALTYTRPVNGQRLGDEGVEVVVAAGGQAGQCAPYRLRFTSCLMETAAGI